MARLGRSRPAVASQPIEQYAGRMHRLLDGHGVCSPLGAWLLLALVADSAVDVDRARLAVILGADLAAARETALQLLRDPHPDVAAAAACWADPTVTGPAFAALSAAIGPPADTGPVPSQQQADAWAAERTLGLIDRFPIDLGGAPVLMLLATALATRINWRRPYELADPDDVTRPVGDPRFADAELLRAPSDSTWTGIVDGRFAAHCASSPEGLVVASVIGDPSDDPDEVLAVAQRTAVAYARDEDVPGVVPLFDLPLGDGAAWRITEQRQTGGRERFVTLLPAWRADSTHDLLADPDLGFVAAGRAVTALLDTPVDPEVTQAAVARYSRTGFQAAAVTALAMRASAMTAVTHVVRTAQVEFTHPYAVVAATGGRGAWRGLPVFSAWVAEPGS